MLLLLPPDCCWPAVNLQKVSGGWRQRNIVLSSMTWTLLKQGLPSPTLSDVGSAPHFCSTEHLASVHLTWKGGVFNALCLEQDGSEEAAQADENRELSYVTLPWNCHQEMYLETKECVHKPTLNGGG
ncbi:uncharacterized protein LOC128322230 isoform X4 [Hemicordylus capensis]|uniref:uncharacterized protein LOC128322230 isoform X4 n=1 Tax=Hemicordylus capensis TaxID=884348 RepID=UPI0023037C9C|nr:uncharacterized protein LOC128322230 isoform X4 [Hemicordylus capensis]